MSALPPRIDFLLHCNFGDFLETREFKLKFRTVLGKFGDELTEDAWNGFGVFRSKMEMVVGLVVNDALGRSPDNPMSFKDAIAQFDNLNRHFRVTKNETADTFLRSVRWGISGFQIFKNMDTHGHQSDQYPNHVPIVDCVKKYWSTIAYVQMQTIVCCLEWLHDAFVRWQRLDSAPNGRSSTYPGIERSPSPTHDSDRQASPPVTPPAHRYPTTAAPLPSPPSKHEISSPRPPPDMPVSLHVSPVVVAATAQDMLAVPRQQPPLLPPAGFPPLPVAAPAPSPIAVYRAPVNVVTPMQTPPISKTKFTTDVYNELVRRDKLGVKPRYFAKCKYTVCKNQSCNYGHSNQELKIIGVTRAISIGDVWKTVECNNPNCQFPGCDYLHESDKRSAIDSLKVQARDIVDHARVSDDAGDALMVTFCDGRTVNVKMK
ncbi:hypothetical protein DYB32_006018 [Aphanomyces invadans]|uniref:Uncharacterized protein n=1 Tax=Aphanomyces invadans TaxID=157072 RepID=A0A418ASM7_9STRA|nr:hypothetical protein DYB32_006018 [Aphanomyces invadans]